MTNTEGLAAMLAALAPHLSDADQALIALAESLAEAADADRCEKCGVKGQTAALWKEYRATLMDLRQAGAHDDADDDEEFRSAVVTPLRRAAVGHTP